MTQVATKVADVEYRRIKVLEKMGYYRNVADFVRDAIRARLEEMSYVLDLRNIPDEKAKGEILDYFKSHEIVYPSDIGTNLHLDMEQVLRILDELKKEEVVKGLE